MNAIVYLFQVSACMGIFYLFYYLLLSRYTFFTTNRWYLIVTLAISFIIPLLTITVQQQDAYPQVIKQVVYINQMQTTPQTVVVNEAPQQAQINWMGVVKIMYAVSVFALLLRLMLVVVKFFTRIKGKKSTKINGVHILQGDEKISNGSFFNFIFLRDDELSADELEQIIAHEMLHVKLYHSIDRMLVKIAQVFLWFNPFVYLYARAIEENHEFEVDRSISNATDRNKYAELLFHLSVARQGTLYHNFSMVPLKKRITMLFTKPTNRIKRIIYLLVVPVVLISCLAFAKLKKEAPAKKTAEVVPFDSTTVKYRQRSKRTPAQIKADEEAHAKMMAYLASPEAKAKIDFSKTLTAKVVTATVLRDYRNDKGLFRGKILKEKSSGNEFLLLSWYGQEKQLNSQLNVGDDVDIKVLGAGIGPEGPVTVIPAYVVKNGKEIFRSAEADKLPERAFLHEANKVRYADGQVSQITKYPNGKWKTALFETVNGYKFSLSFKPDAPNLNSIVWGDHVRLRFIHEVKTGAKSYKVNDWVSISTDIKDYGVKNPEWFNKFYEVVKTDTMRVSAIKGIETLGANPLVLIDGKEYSKDILYKISNRGFKGWGLFPPNDGTTKYGERARDGAVVIETRGGEINYLSDNEKQNLLKIRAAKGKFFSRIRLTKDDGTAYDLVAITRASGGGGNTDVPVNAKVAFIINNEVYNEAQFKRLFPADRVELGRAIGVSGSTKEYTDRGFKLDGYDAVFEFPEATVEPPKTPVKPGVLKAQKKANTNTKLTNNATTGKAGQTKLSNSLATPQYRSWGLGAKPTIGKPALITGGQSDSDNRLSGSSIIGVRGNKNFRVVGFGSRYPKYPPADASNAEPSNSSKPNSTNETDKSGREAAPGAKDTVSGNTKNTKQLLAMSSGFEVKADGSVWINNQRVNKARINGQDYVGDGLGQAIKTLPAEIVERFSNSAAENDSSKPVNAVSITTKPDKANETVKDK